MKEERNKPKHSSAFFFLGDSILSHLRNPVPDFDRRKGKLSSGHCYTAQRIHPQPSSWVFFLSHKQTHLPHNTRRRILGETYSTEYGVVTDKKTWRQK